MDLLKTPPTVDTMINFNIEPLGNMETDNFSNGTASFDKDAPG